MRVYRLDDARCDEDDEADIRVYLPGPVGPPIVDVGSRTHPALITSFIAPPVNRRQRSFIKGATGPAMTPAIAAPADNGPWELYLFCTDDVAVVVLESVGNIELSGQWIGANGSILYLQWDGASKWVEGGRNEI